MTTAPASPLLWKLLRRNISVTQLAGFAAASLVGLTVVALAVQLWCDVRPLLTDDDSSVMGDYLTVSRRVTNAGALLGHADGFGPADLDTLRRQPWCRRVGELKASNFGVQVSIGLGDGARALRTGLFFESAPEDFLDIDATGWRFDPSQPAVPVVLSRDYLSLYNFGYATTQGLPRLSEGQAGLLPLAFTLTGNGHSDVLPGRIVGFSSRVSGVLVPDDFLQWAAARYAGCPPPAPQRLIVEVTSPGDQRIADFMAAHGYEVGGDKMQTGKASYFLAVAMSVVGAVGVVITALALFVLVLSINLLLQKNTARLLGLLRLGYSADQCARPYVRLVGLLGVGVLLVACLLLMAIRAAYLPTLHALGTGGGSLLPALLTATAVMGAVTVVNIVLIYRRIRTLTRHA